MDGEETRPEQEEITRQDESSVQYVQKEAAESQKGPTWKQKLANFFVECRRVLRVTKKPNKEEFKTIVKISGLGILIIGVVGFLIHFLKELIF